MGPERPSLQHRTRPGPQRHQQNDTEGPTIAGIVRERLMLMHAGGARCLSGHPGNPGNPEPVFVDRAGIEPQGVGVAPGGGPGGAGKANGSTAAPGVPAATASYRAVPTGE